LALKKLDVLCEWLETSSEAWKSLVEVQDAIVVDQKLIIYSYRDPVMIQSRALLRIRYGSGFNKFDSPNTAYKNYIARIRIKKKFW
jgi:hypothetical protein